MVSSAVLAYVPKSAYDVIATAKFHFQKTSGVWVRMRCLVDPELFPQVDPPCCSVSLTGKDTSNKPLALLPDNLALVKHNIHKEVSTWDQSDKHLDAAVKLK